MKSFGRAAKLADQHVANMQLIGSRDKLEWTQEADALAMKFPHKLPTAHAVAFRVTFAAEKR